MNNFETEGPTLHEALVALGMICAGDRAGVDVGVLRGEWVMTKRFCDYCGKEVSSSSMEWQRISVLIGEVLTVAVNVYKQHSGDTDLCHVCYADALEAAANNVRANLTGSESKPR